MTFACSSEHCLARVCPCCCGVPAMARTLPADASYVAGNVARLYTPVSVLLLSPLLAYFASLYLALPGAPGVPAAGVPHRDEVSRIAPGVRCASGCCSACRWSACAWFPSVAPGTGGSRSWLFLKTGSVFLIAPGTSGSRSWLFLKIWLRVPDGSGNRWLPFNQRQPCHFFACFTHQFQSREQERPSRWRRAT